MFNKIIKITTPIILVGVILSISYNTYQDTLKSTKSPINVIPTNASIIIQLNNLENIETTLQKSDIWKRMQNIKQIRNINNEAKEAQGLILNNNELFPFNHLFISLHKVGKNKNATLFSANFKQNENINHNEIISLLGNKIETSEYDNQTIYFIEPLRSYFCFRSDILFFSKSKTLLTDAIRSSAEETDNLYTSISFSECYKTINESSDINLMINYNNLITLANTSIDLPKEMLNFSEWTATDIKIKDNTILASGLSALNKSTSNFTDLFKNQKPKKLEILDILPESTTQLFAISFNNKKKIYENKNQLLQTKNEFWSWNKNRKTIQEKYNIDYNEFINEIDDEAGFFNTSPTLSNQDAYTYFKTEESIRAASLIQEMTTSSLDYKNFRINKIKDHNIVSNLFGSLFKKDNPFFTTINNFFIFGNSELAIKNIIDYYTTKNILAKDRSFKKLDPYISQSTNIFLYLNPGKIKEALDKHAIDTSHFSFNRDSIIKFTSFSIQLNTTKNNLWNNLCILYDTKYTENLKEEWYHPLDTISRINPQFVHNHFTNQKIILCQDKYNNIIALNTSGEKIWNKEIDSQILGSINFIDAYKNNKFQALFNTKDQLHLIDRNGEYVDGFPKNLPSVTSMGHSLFDYEKNKNYRILIVGDDNTIYNLNKKGDRVAGWKYKTTKNRITQKPIHFIVKDKDYILSATQDNTTQLLARNGSERTTFDDIEYFTSPINISQEGTLYAITSQNKLWNANTKGEVQIIDLPKLDTNSKILNYNNGYYIANRDIISYINNTNNEKFDIQLDAPIKTLSLLEGYLSITTENSLYLIQDDEVLDGFPIESDGLFNISDIDNNGKVNIINIKNSVIYNYELGSASQANK